MKSTKTIGFFAGHWDEKTNPSCFLSQWDIRITSLALSSLWEFPYPCIISEPVIGADTLLAVWFGVSPVLYLLKIFFQRYDTKVEEPFRVTKACIEPSTAGDKVINTASILSVFLVILTKFNSAHRWECYRSVPYFFMTSVAKILNMKVIPGTAPDRFLDKYAKVNFAHWCECYRSLP